MAMTPVPHDYEAFDGRAFAATLERLAPNVPFEELAMWAGLRGETVRQLVRTPGRDPRVSTIMRLARALGVDPWRERWLAEPEREPVRSFRTLMRV